MRASARSGPPGSPRQPSTAARGGTAFAWLVTMASLWAGGGASCHQLANQYTAPIPRALPPAPSLADVAHVVNDNSGRVHSMVASDASISVPLFPALKANLALERPRRFRLRAETALTGPEVDLGSNDEQFWVWVRRSQPPALFFCRHDRFAASPARQIIPIEPEWLIEALGLASFEPGGQHRGPEPVGEGRLRVESLRHTAGGPMTKVTVVDAVRGWVVEQHLYDQRGELVASALAANHRRDPLTDVTLPRDVEIRWPAQNVTMKIHVNQWRINSPELLGPSLWTMPTYPGWEPIDLGNPPDPGAALPQGRRY